MGQAENSVQQRRTCVLQGTMHGEQNSAIKSESVIRRVVGALCFHRRAPKESAGMQQDGGEMTTVSVYYFEAAHLEG